MTIAHIENLKVSDFIEVVSKLEEYNVSEKVDGSQILFGIDEIGFYTSRESKGGSRVYSLEDYPIQFQTTYKRHAHALLESVLPELQSAGLSIGDQIEAEVLYDELPNVIPYSSDTSYLVFLRTISGNTSTSDLYTALSSRFSSVDIILDVPVTTDGITSTIQSEIRSWKFAEVPTIDYDVSALQGALESSILDLENYLSSDSGILGASNQEIDSTTLNKCPTWCPPDKWADVKTQVKTKRHEIKEHVSLIMFDIKEVMLDHIVRPNSSKFGPPAEDGGWIEGVVLTHKRTGHMIKLVDKNTFGVVRCAAWRVRNELVESAKNASNAGSFKGKLYVELASTLGHPQLGTIFSKNYVRSFGTSKAEVLRGLSENIDIGTVKIQFIEIVKDSHSTLKSILDKYEEEKSMYLYEYKNLPANLGLAKSIYLSAIDKRTKEVFASLFEQISNIEQSILASETPEDVVHILIGKHLGELT